MKRYIKKCMCIILSASILTGCSKSGSEESYITLTSPEYEKKIYDTIQIEKGTISPVLSLSLKPDSYKVNSYSMSLDELIVEDVYVEKGSRVNAGDVMIIFKNDGLQDEIKEYEQRLTEDNLLLEHYTNLDKIDSEKDYKEDIKSIQSDIQVVNAYIAEKKAKLIDYQVIAEEGGVVTDISDDIYNGFAKKGSVIIRVASGLSNYTTSTSDEYEFEEGQEFEATIGLASYTMKLISIEENGDKKKLLFEPLSDMSGVNEADVLNIEIQKTPIVNAIYVDEKAVQEINDVYYVFTLDEQGFRHPVEVKIDYFIDGYAIISEGISEGEWVTVE